MHEWQSPKYLAAHFRKHGWRMGLHSLEAYYASARATIERGTVFGYDDDDTGERRVGCYDRSSGRFTIVSDDDR